MTNLLNKFISDKRIKELLGQGEKIDQNIKGRNALHFTAMMPYKRKEKLVLLLKEATAKEINSQDLQEDFKNTPLHILLSNEAKEDAFFYIQHAKGKINFSITDVEGKTSLILAAKINATVVSLELIAQIGNNLTILNQQDKNGMTALHYACLYGNKEVAEKLIMMGASITLTNNKSRTAIDCLGAGKKEIVRVLKSVSIDPNRDENSHYNCFVDKLFQPLMNASLQENGQYKPVPTGHLLATKSNISALGRMLDGSLINTESLA